jgi:hypothetical protein
VPPQPPGAAAPAPAPVPAAAAPAGAPAVIDMPHIAAALETAMANIAQSLRDAGAAPAGPAGAHRDAAGAAAAGAAARDDAQAGGAGDGDEEMPDAQDAAAGAGVADASPTPAAAALAPSGGGGGDVEMAAAPAPGSSLGAELSRVAQARRPPRPQARPRALWWWLHHGPGRLHARPGKGPAAASVLWVAGLGRTGRAGAWAQPCRAWSPMARDGERDSGQGAGIDLAFLEALPPELRAEVLSAHGAEVPAAEPAPALAAPAPAPGADAPAAAAPAAADGPGPQAAGAAPLPSPELCAALLCAGLLPRASGRGGGVWACDA